MEKAKSANTSASNSWAWLFRSGNDVIQVASTSISKEKLTVMVKKQTASVENYDINVLVALAQKYNIGIDNSTSLSKFAVDSRNGILALAVLRNNMSSEQARNQISDTMIKDTQIFDGHRNDILHALYNADHASMPAPLLAELHIRHDGINVDYKWNLAAAKLIK